MLPHAVHTPTHTHSYEREREREREREEQECTTMFLCFLLLLQRFIECLWILHSAQHGNEKWNSLCLYLHSWQTSWISLGIIVFLFAWIAQLLAPSRIVTRYASAASWKQQRMYLSIQEIESWRSQWVTCYLHVWVPDVQLQSQVHNCLVWCYVRIFLFVLISTSNQLFSFAVGKWVTIRVPSVGLNTFEQNFRVATFSTHCFFSCCIALCFYVCVQQEHPGVKTGTQICFNSKLEGAIVFCTQKAHTHTCTIVYL